MRASHASHASCAAVGLRSRRRHGRGPDAAEPVTWDTTIDALASFTRTLISADSPFDRYAFQQDASALSEAELRGLAYLLSVTMRLWGSHLLG